MKKDQFSLFTALVAIIIISFGCNKADRNNALDIEKAFDKYAKEEGLPDYKGVANVECTDTIHIEELMTIHELEANMDSTMQVLRAKLDDLLAYSKSQSRAVMQQRITEFARISSHGWEVLGDCDKNKEGLLSALKNAVENLSPYGQPLLIYHINAKVASREVSFFAFAVGEDIEFVRADEMADAARKDKRLLKIYEAEMNVIDSHLVPLDLAIEDINDFIEDDN